MLCPTCSTQNEEGGTYCVGCGAALAPGAWASPAAPGTPQPPSAWNPPAAPTSTSAWPPPASPADAPTPGGFYSPASPMAEASSQNAGPITNMAMTDALILPLQDPDAAPRIGVGSLLCLLPLLGQIWLAGYVLRWTRRLLQGERRDLPAWDDFGGIFVDGMWASVLGTVFTFVPIVLTLFLAIPRFLSIVQQVSARHNIDPFPIIFSILGYLSLGLFLMLIFSLPVPLAICHFARTGDLIGAMSPGTWLPLIMQSPVEFAGSWLAVIIASFVGWTALGFLNIIPIIGSLACAVGTLPLTVMLLLGTQTIFARYCLRHAGRAVGE